MQTVCNGSKCHSGREKNCPQPIDRLGLACGLLIIFQQLYWTLGLQLVDTDFFSQRGWGILFGADVPRVIADLTVPEASHYRVIVHPLFVFWFNPIGSVLRVLLHSEILAALLLNTIAGGIAVALCFVFFRTTGGQRIASILLSILFGVTTTQLIFGSIVETYAFATSTIIFAYIVLARAATKRIPLWEWVLAGVATLSITTTNIVQSAICFLVAPKKPGWARRFLVFVLLVGGILLALNTLQRSMYYGARWFVSPDVFEEQRYISFVALQYPIAALVDTATNMLLYNVVAPRAQLGIVHDWHLPAIGFGAPTALSVLGLLIWIGLLATGCRVSFNDDRTKRLALAALLGFGFNVALHNVYGSGQRFLYSSHYTFLLIALLAPLAARRVGWTTLAILALLIVMLVANFSFWHHMVAAF